MNENNQVRVLVAEDDYLVSEMVQGLLHEMGYQILGVASNGRQAVEMAQKTKPDVIIMDIQMADMDGITATREIQRDTPTPVVVLTAYETSDLVKEASQAGVGAYLIKPPNGRELERAITIAMARHKDMIELQRLNTALTEYNEELDAFAHTVAHDLKNLAALMIGYSGMLLENLDHFPHAEDRGYIKVISQNGKKMDQIIEELMLLAGVRKESVEPHPFNTASAVDESLQRLALMIDTRQAEIKLPDEWPTAVGYAPWIEEVWVNYLSNAIKYGGDPPIITLGADEASGGVVRFWVRDNGPGLSQQDQSRLFAPFTQLNQVTKTGYGLGLSIVQRIVAKLNGQTGVESELGQGSLFWFTLPAAVDAPANS